MEFLNTLWVSTILPFFMSYGITLVATLVIAMILSLIAISLVLLKPIAQYLKSLAEKHLSEKVSKRVNDSIVKVENVLFDLLTIQHNTVKRLAEEAYENDGKIDMKEVANIAKEVASLALARLTPEVSTLQKYLAGDMVVEYIQDKVSAAITQSVENFLNEKMALSGSKK